MDKLKTILEKFQSISLQEMDNVKLLNRTDTKFVFSCKNLEEFLSSCSKDYALLTIQNKNIAHYKTLYFDTSDFDFYHHHHNKKGNRYKVRIRKYVDSNLCFLEIKNKFKGRTIKSRIPINDFEEILSNESIDFIKEITPFESLNSTLWNSFDRITLTNNERKERLTIDLNLSFELKNKRNTLENVVICELKQEKVNRSSPAFTELKKMQIRPTRISKYCIGTSILYKKMKSNIFKEKHIQLAKITA